MADGYTDTPQIPDQKWRVHDAERPQPPIVTPTNLPEISPVAPPSDAIVLFDGTAATAKHWRHINGGGDLQWKLADGYMEVVKGTGNIETTRTFGDIQLHVEWAAPTEITGNGQGRGNSGVFLMGRYEIQVLDNYDNPTYADGLAAGIYGQTPPMVNACCPPGAWHNYDILWQAPRFDGEKLAAPAMVTVLHNGVMVHHARQLTGPTTHRDVEGYEPHGDGPIMLQDHGDAVRFRNIWAREIKGYDAG